VLASISGSLTSQIASHGVYAVFVLMTIDAVFPAASELVMLYAGAVAAGAFTNEASVSVLGAGVGFGWPAYLAMALAGALGYLFGSILGWALGFYGGRPLLERYGRWLHLSRERLDRAERWFARWDVLAVLVGRVTPVVRSFISIPAGVFETPLAPYTALTLAGSAIWCFAFAGVGWALGASYDSVHHAFRYVDVVVVVAVVSVAVALVARRRARVG
jgi:membrane protein DedA with SNARE-associated domain